ncbi:glutamate synthase-related protein, partial [Bacteriovoracales bacterium]|nr:glutamate synthase-related protein [Bacteriovoracales bacterium]
HDIYSIEDLKELIYEIKQLDPNLKVSVKLVSGNNIGAIALGVTKAGADIIQISGGDGGTGAAALMSMKHCGLIWERGLLEVHRVLSENGLREQVILRVDGSIQIAHDVIMGSILGADEFDFGKMLLVAEGCIMARVCEKNTCPAGIATQEKKLKERYKGNKDHIVRYLTQVATDIQEQLRLIGVESLSKLRGKTEYLSLNELATFAENKNLNFDNFFKKIDVLEEIPPFSPEKGHHATNEKIIKDLWDEKNLKLTGKMTLHKIFSTERAIGAGLNGIMAKRISTLRSLNNNFDLGEGQILLKGSAGQGLGVFLVEGLKIDLRGDANDFVGKSMSGGLIIVRPDELSSLKPHKNSIIGNCAFYGATGGEAFISGMAGDRFGVRNSGTITVVEGVGLHACEYMTGGRVLILGEHGYNLGAGMTGGAVYIYRPHYEFINTDYIKQVPLTEKDYKVIENNLELHYEYTKSQIAKEHLEKIGDYVKFLPKSMIKF